jgi:hypothetical protein
MRPSATTCTSSLSIDTTTLKFFDCQLLSRARLTALNRTLASPGNVPDVATCPVPHWASNPDCADFKNAAFPARPVPCTCGSHGKRVGRTFAAPGDKRDSRLGRYARLFRRSDWRDVYVGLDEGKCFRRPEGSRSGFDIGFGAGAGYVPRADPAPSDPGVGAGSPAGQDPTPFNGLANG